MKKFITMLIAVFAAGFVLAADYDVYVDVQINDPQFVMQIDEASTNTVTFHILNDGADITATSYTAIMYIDVTDNYGSARMNSVTGTTSGTTATFDMTSLNTYRGYNNWNVLVQLGTTYSVKGKLQIDSTPIAVAGNPASIVGGGGIAVMQIPVQSAKIITTNAYTITSADYGKKIIVNTNTAVTVTLPANGAAIGSWVEVAVHGSASDDCAPTIAAATVDTLIGPNDIDLDSVTWATAHRIGAQAKFWSDGTSWHVQNLGGTTMTYTD